VNDDLTLNDRAGELRPIATFAAWPGWDPPDASRRLRSSFSKNGSFVGPQWANL
jgi:hypothetical protein